MLFNIGMNLTVINFHLTICRMKFEFFFEKYSAKYSPRSCPGCEIRGMTICLSNHVILSTSHFKMGDKKGFYFQLTLSYGNLSICIFPVRDSGYGKNGLPLLPNPFSCSPKGLNVDSAQLEAPMSPPPGAVAPLLGDQLWIIINAATKSSWSSKCSTATNRTPINAATKSSWSSKCSAATNRTQSNAATLSSWSPSNAAATPNLSSSNAAPSRTKYLLDIF